MDKNETREFECDLYSERCATGAVSPCQTCRDIAQPRYPFTITADLGHFRKTAGECPVCSAICDAIVGLQTGLQVTWDKMSFRFNASKPPSRFYAVELTPRDGPCKSQGFQLFTELSKTSPEPVIGAARHIAKESASPACFDLIRHWIAQCNTHPNCVAMLGVETPPTRILDLHARPGFAVLCLTQEAASRYKYIALSHCWGPDGLPDTAKTTRESLADRMQGIPVKALPRSFQDVIAICETLGVHFLWIDSLCIIQKDADDWDKECSRMRDVYRNSYLTISVTRSRDSGCGCFSTRPDAHLSRKVGSIRHQGRSIDVFARRSIDHHDIVSADSFTESFPLFSRAWTLQERLLPRRVLHYAETELIWECNTVTDCECTASQKLLAGWDWQKSTKQVFAQTMATTSRPEFRRYWAILMRRFSLMKLSFDADRLPSMSGLALALESAQTGRYLAGLWEAEILYMIGWMTMGKKASRPLSKPSPPSWSWTSVENGWVSWNYSPDLSTNEWTTVWRKGGGDPSACHDSNSLDIVPCTVKSVSCIPVGKNDMHGRVSCGTLVLSGRLVSAVLEDGCFCKRNGIRQRFTADVPAESVTYVGQTVDCLMIGAMSQESTKYPGLVAVSSLVLPRRESTASDGGTHERIGYMSQNNHFAWKETPLWWSNATETVVKIT